MGEKEELMEMTALFERQEMALAYLYRVVAEKCKDHENFWLEIASQEDTHALMLRTFREMIKNGELEPQLRPFKLQNIEASLERMSNALNFVRRNPITISEALTMSLELENIMLETKMFEPQPDDPPELIKILKILLEDTSKHHAAMKSMLNQVSKAEG